MLNLFPLAIFLTLLCIVCSSCDHPKNTAVHPESVEETIKNVTVDAEPVRTVDTLSDTSAKIHSVSGRDTLLQEKPLSSQAPNVATKTKRKLRGVMTFTDREYQFDTIREGDIIDHTFTFTNTGKSAINIKEAMVTCGCTYPTYPFLPIAPGDSSTIKVTYNSVGKAGSQQAIVTVNSDAADSPTTLILEGYVAPKLID